MNPRHGLIAGGLVAALAFAATGCGGGDEGKKAKAAPTATASSSAAVEPTPTEEAISYATGDLVMSTDDLDAACSGTGSSYDSTVDGTVDESDDGMDDGSGYDDSGFAASASVSEIRDPGLLVLSCSTGDSSSVAVVDARKNEVLWTRGLAADGEGGTDEELLVGGTDHVFVAEVTDHPADGLTAQFFTRSVTAIDVRTGEEAWNAPIAPEDKESSGTSGEVYESPNAAGDAAVAVVTIDDYSAFDAATGKPVWRVPNLDPKDRFEDAEYASYGIVVARGYLNDTEQLNGVDLGTGKIRWSVTIPEAGNALSDTDRSWGLHEGSLWWISDTQYDAYDVKNGKHTAHGVIPTAFQNVLVTPEYTVALVDETSLRAFRTGDWAKPLWSVDANSAKPVLVTSEAVAVQAESGSYLLDMTDGSTLTDLSIDSQPMNGGGLFLDSEGNVIQLGTETD